MQQLIIASKPKLILTLRSYESNQSALMLCRSIERDLVKRNQYDAEIAELQELIDHTTDVIKNME